ncbi:MFS transporter [Polaromonas sp.]|uniref:MFS transporter n=1 Tax=Polaromonas sp. TaxID=1869339 RepID=UPI0017EB6DE0|nr:MFS transporter [Polaromonas sp.]NMM04801.1 MFS transporter [Polaromonas sp.]
MPGHVLAPCDEGIIQAQTACSESPLPRKGFALAATVLGSSMAFIDGSVVNVALPAIQSDLAGRQGANLADMQWVINAYLLALSSLVLVGGSLGDRFGRRTIFITGIALFSVASAACGFATGTLALIAARALQGVGAALLVPTSLAILGNLFEGKARGKAISTWAAWAAITAAAAPVLGGWLVDALSWRAIFFLNLPIAVAAVALALYAVPESRVARAPAQLDWLGALLVALGLGALTYGLTQAPAQGWRAFSVLGSLALGLVTLLAFVLVQARVRSPMMPLGLFRSPDFMGANLLTLLLYFALSGVLFFLPFVLIGAFAYSATAAGAALLPLSLALGLLSSATGRLMQRFGARLMLTIGPVIAAAGLALLALPSEGWSYWTGFFPGMLVLGLGMTLAVAPLTTTVMNAVATSHAGIASGVNNAVARVAGLLAVAAMGVVFSLALGQQVQGAPPEDLIRAFRFVVLAAVLCALGAAACGALFIKAGITPERQS